MGPHNNGCAGMYVCVRVVWGGWGGCVCVCVCEHFMKIFVYLGNIFQFNGILSANLQFKCWLKYLIKWFDKKICNSDC